MQYRIQKTIIAKYLKLIEKSRAKKANEDYKNNENV
jgi:hypothetical protein